MDWTACRDIEQIEGKMGGRPVIKDTRIEPETILQDFELGSSIEEIHENFPSISLETIRRILDFAHARQPVR